MVAGLSSPEVTELFAFHAMEPFGEERADLRAGIVASTVANFAGKQLADGVQRKPADYMPYVEQPAPEPDDTQQTLSEKILGFFKGLKRGRS